MSWTNRPFGKTPVAPNTPGTSAALFQTRDGRRIVAPNTEFVSAYKKLSAGHLVRESELSRDAIAILESVGVNVVKGEGFVAVEGGLVHANDLA